MLIQRNLFLVIMSGLVLTGCMTLPSANSQLDALPEQVPTIIAIGDMHGDYTAYESLMLASGLMDGNGNWSGGNRIFVQTGDIPDRGPDTRKIIESLQRLEQQAPAAGGKVIPMVGNHEAMNVVGDLRYVHPGEYAAFASEGLAASRGDYYEANRAGIEAEYRKTDPAMTADEVRTQWEKDTPPGKPEHRAAWSAKGGIGQWVTGNQVVAKVHGYLFAHGGYSQEFTRFTLDEMNALAATALRAEDRSRDNILRHNLGPLWYRGNVRGRENVKSFDADKEIDSVLRSYDATHIIVGHTRNEAGIRVSRNGRLFQIDTGASAHYGGVPSYLRIENGEFFAHTLGGSKKLEARKIKAE